MGQANATSDADAEHHDFSNEVDYHALASLRFELRKFLAARDEAAARCGLTPQHHQALLAIRGFGQGGTLAVGELAGYLLLRPHSAVELADRLAMLGLVARSPDPGDGRRVLLQLTADGERRLRGLSHVHVRELEEMGAALAALMRSLRTWGRRKS